jgi:hypothetical protein
MATTMKTVTKTDRKRPLSILPSDNDSTLMQLTVRSMMSLMREE